MIYPRTRTLENEDAKAQLVKEEQEHKRFIVTSFIELSYLTFTKKQTQMATPGDRVLFNEHIFYS